MVLRRHIERDETRWETGQQEPPWYGTVCPVVWEDGGGKPASYPIYSMIERIENGGVENHCYNRPQSSEESFTVCLLRVLLWPAVQCVTQCLYQGGNIGLIVFPAPHGAAIDWLSYLIIAEGFHCAPILVVMQATFVPL